MTPHLYADFLENEHSYESSLCEWRNVWRRVQASMPHKTLWQEPWVHTGSPMIRDGNPIFSAFSPLEHRGLRIIQHPPTTNDIELRFWLDTFGGSLTDPTSIQELVISCALSDESLRQAAMLIQQWVRRGFVAVETRHELTASCDDGVERIAPSGVSLPAA